MVIANVAESWNHAFCAAVADHARRQLWVFCSAHARAKKLVPGPCDVMPYRGCYVGAWNASFDNLTAWTPTRKALVLPDGYALFNNDVALVAGQVAARTASMPGAPAHQASSYWFPCSPIAASPCLGRTWKHVMCTLQHLPLANAELTLVSV